MSRTTSSCYVGQTWLIGWNWTLGDNIISSRGDRAPRQIVSTNPGCRHGVSDAKTHMLVRLYIYNLKATPLALKQVVSCISIHKPNLKAKHAKELCMLDSAKSPEIRISFELWNNFPNINIFNQYHETLPMKQNVLLDLPVLSFTLKSFQKNIWVFNSSFTSKVIAMLILPNLKTLFIIVEAPFKTKLNIDLCVAWWCSDGSMNSQEYKSFDIYDLNNITTE